MPEFFLLPKTSTRTVAGRSAKVTELLAKAVELVCENVHAAGL
jgi:hypothetical protein